MAYFKMLSLKKVRKIVRTLAKMVDLAKIWNSIVTFITMVRVPYLFAYNTLFSYKIPSKNQPALLCNHSKYLFLKTKCVSHTPATATNPNNKSSTNNNKWQGTYEMKFDFQDYWVLDFLHH
jgi:hypothetical protein